MGDNVRSEAKKRYDEKYKEKLRLSGKKKQFNAEIDTDYYNTLSNFCTLNNISKAEFLRQICTKIREGSLSEYLNLCDYQKNDEEN